jgi:hypothetical protein
MTKKNWCLIGIAGLLTAVYIAFFTDWFRPQTVRIFHTSRNLRVRNPQNGALPGLIFGVNRQLKLTDIRVVPVAALQTNKNTLPLWHLVSDSNSVPVKSFFYGQFVRGLKPAVPGSRPQPLETNVTYRLIVEAGKVRGEHDFELK